uniref:Uncharacterized protein n=1 Tax=Setaria viridis TaxID=4556 RepID=A0A4U6UYA8_SETVI|nr:hypothetical protein SEVIR_4G135001v2 [Setaria viridis]
MVGAASSTPAPSSPSRKLTLKVTLLADAFDSESHTEMDSYDDHHHGYHTPFTRGDALCIFCHTNNTFACPVCPTMRHRWKILNEVKDHVVGMATFVPLRGKNKKKWSLHHVMARIEGWLG